LCILVLSGCGKVTTTSNDRPVETIVLKSGEATLIATPTKIYFLVREEELEGRDIKNTLTEEYLRDTGLINNQETFTTMITGRNG